MNKFSLFLAALLTTSLVLTGCKRDVQPDARPESPPSEDALQADHAADADRQPTVADEHAQSYSLRMADGTELESVTYEQLMEGLQSLDSDNFFLVLTRGEDFIQTSIIEGGYLVEYKEDGEHQTSVEVISEEDMMRFFSMYYRQEDGWKDLFEWKDH